MHQRFSTGFLARSATALALISLFGAHTVATAAAGTTDAEKTDLTLSTVANPRPQLISGSETLLRMTVSRNTGRPEIFENGRDITASFKLQKDGTYLGLAQNLKQGSNSLTATAGRAHTAVEITAHPLTGPVFSGPQQHPYFCETTSFGLSAAQQPDCFAPTKVTYQYRTQSGVFKRLADPGTTPADAATAHVNGKDVPYIVRVETGTIDRAVYESAVLYDGQPPSPLRPNTSWNGKLVYAFGGGCNGGFHQGNVTGGVLNDLALSQGYGVASSTLNVLDQNCSTVLSAEAAMMVKEHFINVNGPVRYTIGWGGSGGGIQQYTIADAYPGILDGIIPGVSFPDPLATLQRVGDCRLLDTYFHRDDSTFTSSQWQAVAGFLSYDTCRSWDTYFANRLTPIDSCNRQLVSASSAIPPSEMWDPLTRPHGVNCSAQQQMANQLGLDPRTGFAPSLYDNTGVQYGLAALNDKTITPDQFIALNQSIGGYDMRGRPVAGRTTAPTKAITRAYREDLLTSGTQGLRTTPIIDLRTYLDEAGQLSDIHTTQWSYALRARLAKGNGSAANQVIIESQRTPEQVTAANAYALQAMDQWLTNITTNHSPRSAQIKIATDKPAGLADGCYVSATQRIESPLAYPASGPCGDLYPVGSDPRWIAGQPVTSDVLKCRLQPIDFGEYRVNFTSAQKNALRAIYPDGVCDYGKPGQGQQRPMGSWLTYGDGTHGTFGHAPAPRPVESAHPEGR